MKITGADGRTLPASAYSVTYANNKNVGDGKVTVKFTDIDAVKVLKFQIFPKPVKLKGLTAAKKGFTVKWSKQKAQTSGYQIQYSLKSSFKKAKTVTVKSNKTVKKSIKKLKAGKKYYVRVRTYKKVGGIKYYSTWSKKKSVKTK